MTEKLSTYKTSSNYMSSDDMRGSPSYSVTKRISSPGMINQFHSTNLFKIFYRFYNLITIVFNCHFDRSH